MRGSRRIALALVLLAATAGLCVVEAGSEAQRWPYPTTEQVVTDYDATVGERVFLTGTVRETTGTDGTFALAVEDAGRERVLAVRDLDSDVRPGAVVQVLGTVRPGDAVDTERVVVVSPTPGAEWRKWALSGVAVLVFLGLFAREWRVDLRALRVEVRDDG